MEPCADCGSTVNCEVDVGDGKTYCGACFDVWEAQALAQARKRQRPAAPPPPFHLGGAAIEVNTLVQNAEVALRNAKGQILAVVLRNADGAYGRRMVATANIHLEYSNLRSEMAMAGPNRTSSLTSGSTTFDNFETMYNNLASPSSMEVVRLARQVVHAVERREGQAQSLIFAQPDAELECTLRAHAFPPKAPAGTSQAPSKIGKMYFGFDEGMFNEWRDVDPAEGGRMHGHVDQPGTDGVALLNLGGCDFFLDIGKGAGVGRCAAKKTYECWCVGNEGTGGHWVTKEDAPDERYTRFDPAAPRRSLLVDRMCAKCAAGRRGEECESCHRGTVRLCSGDLVVFSGCQAFHGVSAVVHEASRPPPPAAGEPTLPAWAQTKLDDGWRLSMQWRLTNSETARAKERTEMAHATAQAVAEMERATTANATAAATSGGLGKGKVVIEILSDDEAEPAAAVEHKIAAASM